MRITRHSSPNLELTIGAEDVARAVKSNSGGCLIAHAITSQYPHLTSVSVDMATIRVSDRARGERYTYLTPPNAQHVLLAFDQGWPNPSERVTIRRAVKIDRIIRARTGQYSVVASAARREKRIADLETKRARGETLSPYETRALTRMTNYVLKSEDRPAARGESEVVEGPARQTIVRGGAPIPQGPPHPNLLRGRNRHFGAKLADPGQAFNEAVEAAVNERFATGT